MDIREIVKQANAAYDLSLNDQDIGAVSKACQLAGYHQVQTDQMDSVMSLVLHQSGIRKNAVQNPFTVVAVANQENLIDYRCPFCKYPMEMVDLVNRKARTCVVHRITLPIKVEQ